jgi:hypothetical protein
MTPIEHHAPPPFLPSCRAVTVSRQDGDFSGAFLKR